MKTTHYTPESGPRHLSVVICREILETLRGRKTVKCVFASSPAAAWLNSAPSMHRLKACGVRGCYLMIVSNRLPPHPFSFLLFPLPSSSFFSLSLPLSLSTPSSSLSPALTSEVGCAIIPKAFERNPWQPPSSEQCFPSTFE